MSGVAVMRYILANDPRMVALVPATSIFSGELKVGTQPPAITVFSISDVERTTVSMAEISRLVSERVQITWKAANYAELQRIHNALRTACGNRHGSVNGVLVDSILPLGAGPEGFDNGTRIYDKTADYLVRWRT